MPYMPGSLGAIGAHRAGPMMEPGLQAPNQGMRQGDGYQNWLMGQRGGMQRPARMPRPQMLAPQNPYMPQPGMGFPGPMEQPMPQMPQGDMGMIPGGGYTGGQPWNPNWNQAQQLAPWLGGAWMKERFRRG